MTPVSLGRVLVAGFSFCCACFASPVSAQRPATSVTLTTALSFVNFAGLGGRFGAVVGQAAIARRIAGATGIEWSVFALAPGGGATTDPACLPDLACTSFSTPSAIIGSQLAPVVELGTSGLRLSAGVGMARATGGSGFAHRTGGTGSIALEWRARTQSRISPSAGVRLAALTRPLAGARLLLLPGLGVSF